MADESLEVQIDSTAKHILIKLSGPLLLRNLFDFQTAVRSNSGPAVIIDLNEVPYIDSAGLGALLGAKISADGKGQALTLVGVNERVRGTLCMTQVERFFRFCSSVAEAEGAAA